MRRRVDQGGAVVIGQAGQVCGRGEFGAYRVGVEELGGDAELLPESSLLAQAVDLVRPRRDGQRTGTLPTTVDVVAAYRLADLVEIVQPHVLQLGQLGGPATQAVAEAMREADLTEPPLRPDAAQPTSRASTRITSQPGSRSFASSAVHSPQNPPPTTRRSHC